MYTSSDKHRFRLEQFDRQMGSFEHLPGCLMSSSLSTQFVTGLKTFARPGVRLVRKTIRYLNRKRLAPPTSDEVTGIENLRENIASLPILDPADASSSAEAFWLRQRVDLRAKLLRQDPRDFLTWEEIRGTMFESDAAYLTLELRLLQEQANWSTRWQPAIEENDLGLPDRCRSYPRSSGNLIHHAYSLSQWERVSGQSIADLKFVVEFGGGYGSMCRLAFQSGFRGTYVIFDLPEFSALQRYYLHSNRIPLVTTSSHESPGVLLVSDWEEIGALLGSHAIDLFIATWSVSETPLAARMRFLTLIDTAKNVLISYQHAFAEVDNCDFFAKWSAQKAELHWSSWDIAHLPRNRYLVGLSR